MRPFGYAKGEPFTCVVMCGGRGSRFAAVSAHKSMAAVGGAPVLGHVIDYWRALTDDFVFVVKTGKDAVIDFVGKLPIQARFVEPDQLKGIADGLRSVELLVRTPFMVALGDCYCRGTFDFSTGFDWGVGVLRKAEAGQIMRNYAVETLGDRVVAVEEKPVIVRNDLCGMGFYFFQPDVFDHIGRTAPSKRTGELEITDVLQTIAQAGVNLRAVMFDGTYVNVNTPGELDVVAADLASIRPEA